MNTLLEQIASSFFTLLADIVIIFTMIGVSLWAEDVKKDIAAVRKCRTFFIATGLCALSATSNFLFAAFQEGLWGFFKVVLIFFGALKVIAALCLLVYSSSIIPMDSTPKKGPKDQEETYKLGTIPPIPSYEIPKPSQPEQNSRLVQAVIDDFAALGWNKWDSSIHSQPEQYKRIVRGNDPHSSFSIYEYSSASGHAKVTGSTGSMYLVSGNGCSCRDFHDRNLPCKHMYYLASQLTLPGYHNIKGGNDFLYRFTFAIAGGSQTKIKDYIKQHKGKVVERIDIDTTALIVNTSKTTQKVIDAQLEHVEVMTFDDLKALF